jgi:cyclin G2
MEVHPLLGQLDCLLAREEVGSSTQVLSSSSGISHGMRDGSAHVLRCLKVWYDLPSDVFHTAVSNIDTFLAKMKAQPKHLSCIAVSSFHLACSQYQQSLPMDTLLVGTPEPADLVSISQSRCSASDLLRMEAILASKLEGGGTQGMPVTPLSFLRVMSAVSRAAATRLEVHPLPRAVPPQHLLHQLEILVCDSTTLKFRPCEVALALLCTEFQQLCAEQPNNTAALMGFVSELQKYCNIQSSHFVIVLSEVVAILERYNGEGQVPHRQRLVWKLSNRTLRHLRPTDRLRPTLPKICEEAAAGVGDKAGQLRLRSASECSLESEGSDSDTGYKAGGSDTESDVEMEEPRSWARIVAAS